ncbi:MAG: preprotein translocase subunit YajC [Verrucomicrobiota bacterium]
MSILAFLAQADTPAAPQGSPMGLFGSPIVFIVIMFALMYFMLIRPQRKQAKKQDLMRKGLRKGDKVVTIGGIHGIVTGTAETTVSVKVADGLSLKFDRSSIASSTPSSREDDSEEDSTES